MAKKDFKGNPSMNFISQMSITKADQQEATPQRTPAGTKAPEGYKVNPEYIEKKTKRVQLLIQPSLYSEAKTLSEELGISLNDLIHRAIHEATYNEYTQDCIRRDITGEFDNE